MSSNAPLISSEGSVRVFVSAAQHIPVAVRTMIVVVPGRLPLCHQFPAPLFRTIHPLAYLPAEPSGYAGLGVVMILMVSGFSKLGIPGKPVTWSRKRTRSEALAIHPPCESMRV